MENNDLIPMTQSDWDELRKLNGGRPIEDRETQEALLRLRDRASVPEGIVRINPTGYNAGLFPIPSMGQESFVRKASVPIGIMEPGQQPDDVSLLKNQQNSILDKEDFDAKLRALKLLQGK